MTVPRPEYPRPHFDRSHSWLSLNGEWGFRADAASALQPTEIGASLPETITVPFAWETEASGVGRHWLARGWYSREITVPDAWSGQRIILNFGAVHHSATVWVNDVKVGSHEGGYTPFEFDVTDALDGRSGHLLVQVDAPLDKRFIVHGKQRSIPRDDYDNCAFTPSSGIWQSVWLEPRPATFVQSLRLDATPELDGIAVRVALSGPSAVDATTRVEVDGGAAFEVTGAISEGVLMIPNPRRWMPNDPHLYRVTVTTTSADGIDTVVGTTGIRRVEVDGDRILLNGEPLYVRGVLDQGYWPKTGITAPTDDAYVTDIELAREAGFNLVRKHLKLEDPRFAWHADRLGMLVWAEPASTGRYSPEGAERFAAQIEPMVDRDRNHPSIVIWGLYNEEWGLNWDLDNDPEKQQVVRDAYVQLKALDTTRPAVDNSGWSHVETDLVDWHIYDPTPAGWRTKLENLFVNHERTFPVGIGIGVVVDKPLNILDDGVVRPNLNSEFGDGFTSVERGWNQRWQTLILRSFRSITGYVWTELYDIEHEMAGIYTFDRGPKDSGGNVAAHSNAAAVLIPDVMPTAPGDDLRVATDRRVEFTVRVGATEGAVDGELVTVWGAPFGDVTDAEFLSAGTDDAPRASAPDFGLGAAVTVRDRLPEGSEFARLHVALVCGDAIAARVALDVTSGPI